MTIDELPPPTSLGTTAHRSPATMPLAPTAVTADDRADDLEPIGLVVSSLVRWSWLIVLAAVLAAGATAFLTRDDGTSTPSATTRLGLTQATVWPFYDVEIEAGLALANTDEFRAELESQVGAPIDSVEATLAEELAVFDITVTAADQATAVQAAQLAADLVLQRSLDANAVYQQDQLAIAQTEIDTLQTRLDETQAQLDEVSATFLDVQEQRQTDPDPALEQQEFEAFSQRESTAQILRDLEREMATKVSERDALAADTPESMLRIVRTGSADEVDESSSNALAIGAGLAVLLTAAVVVVLVDRRRGKVRSTWQLVHVCGAPDAGDLQIVDQGRLLGLGAFADRVDALADQVGHGEQTIGVVDLSQRLDLDQLAAQLRLHGIDIGIRGDGAMLELVDVSHEHQGPDIPRPLTRTCDALVVVAGPSTSLSSATETIRRARRAPGLAACLFLRG